ncbi:hypothetical protein [Streptomyces hokutonensis]|uniref:hypothetical protein n=1 Tax=Streptomyces hokutonensis TaxID=1306990 RepID=UPI0036C3802F
MACGQRFLGLPSNQRLLGRRPFRRLLGPSPHHRLLTPSPHHRTLTPSPHHRTLTPSPHHPLLSSSSPHRDQQRVERLRRVAGPQREHPVQRVAVRRGGESSGAVALAGLPGVAGGAVEEAGLFAGVAGEGGGTFHQGAGEGVFTCRPCLARRRTEFGGEAHAGAERARAPVPGAPGRLALRAQHPREQPVDIPPVRRGPGLIRGDPRPRVTEHDPAGRRLRDPCRLGGFQGPGVEPARRDGAQEGMGGDRVLVGGGEQQEQSGVFGQGTDLAAVAVQQLRCQRRRFGR